MAAKKVVTPPPSGEGAEKVAHSYTVGGSVKWHTHSGKFAGFLK